MKEKKKASWQLRILSLFFVLVSGGVVLFFWWNDGLSPIDEHDISPVMFIVNKGESVRNIASRLASERLIRSRTVFFLLTKVQGIDNKLQAGNFRVNRSMNAEKIADTLTHGAVDEWVTILEGWRVEEIATKLTEELKIPSQEFIAAATEGYMFPDTYLLPKDATAGAIVDILHKNFDKRVTIDMKKTALEQGLTLDQVVILASLVEREGRNTEDRPVIAGILLNRLHNNMPLDVDATLQYMLGYDVNEKTWWRKNITDEHKKNTSPYNTYKYADLPPKPIANPGLGSITAVIYSTKSDYFYYLHDADGIAHYGKTLDEHEANIRKYLR